MLRYLHLFQKFCTNKLYVEYHRLSIWYFVSFIVGIISYFALLHEASTRHVISVFAGSLWLLYYKKHDTIWWQFLACLIIAFVFGILVCKYRVSNLQVTPLTLPVISQVEGAISSIRPTTHGMQIVLNSCVISKLKAQKVKVKINIPNKYSKELLINDRIRVLAKLYKPQGVIVPGGYDFGFYAHFAGISASGYAMSIPKVISRNDTGIEFAIYKVRKAVYNRLIATLGENNGNFGAAILLGETKGINQQVMQNMRLSGISHILCVSGLHLSLVAMIFFVTIRFLLNVSDFLNYNCNIKLIAAICAFVGSYGYLQLSGMQIAATRAFIMTAIFIISVMCGRTPYPLRSIAIAALYYP